MALHLSKRASSDLDAIWKHLLTETHDEAVADHQIDAITSRFYLLVDHPRIGRARDDDLGRGRRSFPVNDYVIVYRIVGADVQILRVAHGRRDLPSLFGR